MQSTSVSLAPVTEDQTNEKWTLAKTTCVKCDMQKGPGAFIRPCDSECAICKHCSRASVDAQLKLAGMDTEIECEICDGPMGWKQLKRLLAMQKYHE